METKRLKDGRLADVTPTLLEIGGLAPWPEVTGHSSSPRRTESSFFTRRGLPDYSAGRPSSC